MEGAYAISTGKLDKFSEQQLVDCSGPEGDQGCNGGLMDNAFTYAETSKIELGADYPYTARDGKCTYSSLKGIFEVSKYADVQPNSE